MINTRTSGGRFAVAAQFCLLSTLFALPTAAADKVFFGNLHSHTSYSDGSGTPSEAYAHARDVAKLDFLAITEHNHRLAESDAGDRKDGVLIATDHTLYNGSQSSSLIKTAERLNDPGKFVALYGQEFSSISKGNHMNVFDVAEVIDDSTVPNGDFSSLITWLGTHHDTMDQPAILQLNHPSLKLRQQGIEYGSDDFSHSDWLQKIGGEAATIEILNGPALTPVEGKRSDADAEKSYIYYLNQGFKLAPTGDQDNHYRTWGSITDTRTAIITDSLDKASILGALRARHVYATEDKNLRVVFRVNGHLCGDQLGGLTSGTHLDIQYWISDDDEPAANYEIEAFAGTVGGQGVAVVGTVQVDGDNPSGEARSLDDITYAGGSEFIYFKITQTSEHGVPDRAWTAPIFLSAEGASTPAPTPTPAASVFIASRKQSVYHISEDCRSAKAIKPENRITGDEARNGRSLHTGCPVK